MRVFCPEHAKGFFAPRQNPIRCENRMHNMGELDFEGQAGTPAEAQWQYCCNCEHFCPLGSGPQGTERCPACARQFSARYLCDRCYTMSCESNTEVKTKNFTLTSEGRPHPVCPGCLQSATGDLGEHDCDAFGAPFVTALTSCPICQERLDVAPTFPAAVAYYLKRARNKLSVTFDYESELFQPAEDGEFMVVRNGNQPGHELMLPRLPRFSSKREFYNYYQDSFYCAEPSTGEVQVIEPAVVDRVEEGWKLKTHGVLEVVGKAAITKTKGVKSIKAEEGLEKRAETTSCPHCNSVVETKYPFCWHCGKSIKTQAAPAAMAFEDVNRVEQSELDDEITLSPEARVSTSAPPSIFAWASEERPAQAASGGPAFKLIALVIGALVLVSLLLFVVFRRSSSPAPTESADGQTAGNAIQSEQAAEPAEPSAQTAKAVMTDSHPADLELEKLRDKIAAAPNPDRVSALKSLAAAEKRYPNDYRFPYERARLSIDPQETRSHHEAFESLLLAAQKAIDNGKANEMLASLRTDKDGDFQKLSRGHEEWKQLEQALQNRNKSALTAQLHH